MPVGNCPRHRRLSRARRSPRNGLIAVSATVPSYDRFIAGATAATVATMAFLWSHTSIRGRDILLLAAAAPFVMYLLRRRATLMSVPRSAGSPITQISWDCSEAIVIPLALIVPVVAVATLNGLLEGITDYRPKGAP